MPTEYAMQVDVYGPRSGNNSKIIEGLFYSEFGTTDFRASGLAISPLYVERPSQMGFVSGEDQWIDRWMLEVLEFDRAVARGKAYAAAHPDTLVIVTADHDETRAKPRPDLYLEALDVLGVAAAEAVAFEDSPNGTSAARAAA